MKRDIVEAWLWKPPGDIIEELLARSTRLELRAVSRETKCGAEPLQVLARKDRYYTMARRARVRALTKGKP